ncbi:hypothetical protein Taro_047535 [Colocasia esculenta]|uniref:Uncharacterized protein n=1 Tax=Colocasia esculenta TaxID=4460 RepID=A0A843X5J4_COLES|nr:hypothetical protein [Colocasia esculenta]
MIPPSGFLLTPLEEFKQQLSTIKRKSCSSDSYGRSSSKSYSRSNINNYGRSSSSFNRSNGSSSERLSKWSEEEFDELKLGEDLSTDGYHLSTGGFYLSTSTGSSGILGSGSMKPVDS